MFVGQRSLRIIVLSLIVLLISINLTLWATSGTLDDNYIFANFHFFHTGGQYQFKGFRWFFDRLSTFPGIYYTQNTLNSWTNIISGFKVTGVGVIDSLLAIFRILSTPILLVVTITADLFMSAAWFFSFFINDYGGVEDFIS